MVLISCDLVGTDHEIVKAARELIEARHGIPASSVMIASTHTHSGPTAISLGNTWGAVSPKCTETLPQSLADSVGVAMDEMIPITLCHARGEIAELAHNRVAADGPVDQNMDVIRADREDGEPLAIICHASSHAVTNRHTNTLVSRDFPGVICDSLETIWPGSTAMFLQGACGDVNPNFVHTGKRLEAGLIAAGRAVTLAAMAEPLEVVRLSAHSEVVELPMAPLTADEVVATAERETAKMEKNDSGGVWARFYREWLTSWSANWVMTSWQTLKAWKYKLFASRIWSWPGIPLSCFRNIPSECGNLRLATASCRWDMQEVWSAMCPILRRTRLVRMKPIWCHGFLRSGDFALTWEIF